MNDPQILEAALEGLLAQKQRIEDQIGQVRSMLGKAAPRARTATTGNPAAAASAPRKRVMSAAARKRIAEAQKKRWAEFRKKTAANEE